MKKYFYIGVLFLIFFPLKVSAESKTNNIFIEPRWGWYFPNNRSWWKEGSAQSRYSFYGGLEAKYTVIDSAEIALGLGYFRESWERENAQDPNSKLYNHIYMLPANISINYRLKFSRKQIIIPYVGMGFDYIYCEERQEPTIRFHRYGHHFTLGGQILLNRFVSEEDGDLFMDEKFGINAAYITLEARYADVDNFGNLDGHDISGYFYSMGILLEF